MHVSPAAAGSLGSGWLGAQEPERARLAEQARASDAARQLQRCFPRWIRLLEQLSWRALARLAATSPSTPTTPTAGAVATSTPRWCCAATASPRPTRLALTPQAHRR